MFIKAEFILETDSCLPLLSMEEFILNIFSNNENISDYAFLYTRKSEEENWRELNE